MSALWTAPLVLAALANALQTTGVASTSRSTPRWISTEHLGRLTDTATNPIRDVGIAGTDLGVSFEAHGRLVFLFGDSWTVDRKDWDGDSVALAPVGALAREGLPKLTWLTRAGASRFLALAPRDLALGGMDVPVEGLAVGETTYVFFDAGWGPKTKRHTHSLLAHTRKLDLGSLTLDHSVASEKFLNVSVVADGATAWIFGTGAYRASAVHLARVPLAQIADRASWRYWPDFTPGEASARPLVASSDYGEISVRKLPRSKRWWMAANSGAPRGIHLRWADAATGPWSEPLVVLDPFRDRAYGTFIHQSSGAVGFDDGLSEPGREDQWGGEYGPYLVPAWSSAPVEGVLGVVFTLSSWNPYQVHVVRAWIAEGDVEWTPRETTKVAAAPKKLANSDFTSGDTREWTSEGDAFTVATRADGSRELTTYVKPQGDGVRGRLWQDFTVPSGARELRCFVKGGSESVRLLRGGEVLRESRGRRTNDVETQVRWSIERYSGERLRVEILDDSTDRWGFVTVRGLELAR